VRFRILGPLQVSDGQRAVELGSRKQRALLAVLVLDANHVVSSARIVQALWGPDADRPNDGTLHAYVSRLRRCLRTDEDGGRSRHILERRPGGYVLEIDPRSIDALEFERLVDEGSVAQRAGDAIAAIERFEAALALWHGHVLGDLHDEEFARSAVARLEARRLDAIEARLEALLAAGRPEAVVADTPSVLVEHPYRERLRGQLMLALYRCGRQADALAVYQEGRRLLVEELGIEPDPAVQRLEAQIIRQDPELDGPRATGERPARAGREVALPSTLRASGPFVGRAAQITVLEHSVRDLPDGRTRLVLISGEPGVGKSRLAAEVASRWHLAGATVLHGSCYEEPAIPFQPVADAVRGFVRTASVDVVRTVAMGAGPYLARLVPELARRVPELPDVATVSPETERHLLFEATAELLVAAAQEGPVLLVLDDVHWADASTWSLLAHVTRSPGAGPVLLVVTARSAEIPDHARSLLSGLGREGRAIEVALDGLAIDEVGVLVGAQAGAVPPDFVTALHDLTGGNPFYVEQVLCHLEEAADGGGRGPLELLAGGVPTEVRHVIARRVSRLPPGAGDLLALGAVVGRDFTLDVLTAVSRRDADEVVDAMDSATAAGLVDEPAAGVWRFVHPLTREALYGGLSRTRRARLHQQIGRALAATAAGEDHLAAIATHLLLGGEDRATAAEYAWRAGVQALDRLAHEEAVALAERGLAAIEALEAPGSVDAQTGSRRCDLLVVAAEGHRRAGDIERAHQLLLAAGEEARRRGDPRRLAEVGLAEPRGMVSASPEADPARAELLQESLAGLPDGEDGDDPVRARVLGQLAVERYYRADRTVVDKLSLAALSMARRLHDPEVLLHVLLCRHIAAQDPAHVDERLDLLDELERTAVRLGRSETAVLGRLYRAVALMESGDVAGADAVVDGCERDLEDVWLPLLRFAPLYYRSMRLLMSGPLDEAERRTNDMGETLVHAGYPDALQMYGAQLYVLRWLQGRLDELEAPARRALQSSDLPIWRAVLAHLLAEGGRLDEAAEHLDELARDEFAAVPFDNMWLTALVACAEVCAATGNRPDAAVLHRALSPYASRPVVLATAVACGGAVDRTLGELATTAGRWEDAAAHFDDAERLHRAWGAHSFAPLVDRGRLRLASAQEYHLNGGS
jgi:DNA-binding SARP family transcriptional activator